MSLCFEIVDGKQWFLLYPRDDFFTHSSFWQKISHIKNIGTFMVSVLMPFITQKMLDSFHASSVGEETRHTSQETQELDTLMNGNHPELERVYKKQGILMTKIWLQRKLSEFYNGKICVEWISLFVDFMCLTGKPLGISLHNLAQREEMYQTFSQEMKYGNEIIEKNVLKIAKLTAPIKPLQKAAKQNATDTLSSFHSIEFFHN